MTVIFEDSFESGGLTNWSATNSPTNTSISTTRTWVQQGRYGCMFNSTTSSSVAMYLQKTIPDADEVYLRFYTKITASSASDIATSLYLAQLRSASGSCAQLSLINQNGNAHLQLHYYSGQNLYKTSTAHLLFDTVYCVELHFKRGSNSAVINVYLNGGELPEMAVTGANITSQCTSILLGSMNSSQVTGGFSTFYDDVMVSDSYIGTIGIILLTSEHTPLEKQQLLDYIWEYKDGMWTPSKKSFPTGNSFIRLFDTEQKLEGDIFEIIIDEKLAPPDKYSRVLGVSTGFVVKKDITCGGFVAANQGILSVGSGLLTQWDPPGVILLHADKSSIHDIFQGSSPPPNAVEGMYFINTSDNVLYRRVNGSWQNKGLAANCTYNFDTFYIRKFGYPYPFPPFTASPSSPFDGSNRPIPEGYLGHLKCANITAQNINPSDDNIRKLGSDSSAWLGVYAHTLFTDEFKKLDGSLWNFTSLDAYGYLTASGIHLGAGYPDIYRASGNRAVINGNFEVDGNTALGSLNVNGIIGLTGDLNGNCFIQFGSGTGALRLAKTGSSLLSIQQWSGSVWNLADMYVAGIYTSWLNTTQGSGGVIGVLAPLSFNGTTGTSGQVLTSNGTNLPTWKTPSANNTWNGGTVTNGITIQRADPQMVLNATSGNPALIYSKNSTTQMGLIYNTSTNSFYLWDYPGSKVLASINTNGNMSVLGTITTHGMLELPGYNAGIELGHPTNGGTPYIDFHFGKGVSQDFNVRLINIADGWLRLVGHLDVGGDTKVEHSGDVFLNVNSTNSSIAVVNIARGGNTQAMFGVGTDNRAYINTANDIPLDLRSGSGAIFAQHDFTFQGTVYLRKTEPVINWYNATGSTLYFSAGYANNAFFLNCRNSSQGLVIATDGNGDITLAPSNLGGGSSGQVVVANGHSVNPMGSNSGTLGTSSRYWSSFHVNDHYAKLHHTFGCERSLSGQEWVPWFKDRLSAEKALSDELTRPRYHILYDSDSDDKIVCTCGKKVITPCPEHLEEWNNRYTINLDKLIHASSYLTLESKERILQLEGEVAELKRRLEKLSVKKAGVSD